MTPWVPKENNVRAACMGVSVIALIALLAKHLIPVLIPFFYHHHNIALLNILSGASIAAHDLPLEFYLGRVEEVSLGPASAVFCALAFLLLSVRYWAQASALKFAGAVFVYFLITKSEVLLFPPFGDDMTGPFTEGIWLCQNAFDYRLLSQQPTFIHGGAKVYLFSIYPTFLAAGMTLITNTKAFLFLNHLLSFGLAAGVVALFRSMALRSFSPRLSLLLSVLLMTFPVFQAQAESINMDMPALFFSMAAVHALGERKFLRAGLCALVAMSIKFYAFFIGLTVFVMCAVIFLTQTNGKKRFDILFSGCLPLVFGILQAFLLSKFLNSHDNSYAVGVFSGRIWLARSTALYLFVLSVLALAVLGARKGLWSSGEKCVRFVEKYDTALLCFVAVAGWFVIFGQSYFFGVRYYVHMVPFFIFCIAFFTSVIFKSRRTVAFLALIAIVLAGTCSYGVNYTDRDYGQGSARSLEYRSAVHFYAQLVGRVEEQFPGRTVVAPLLVAQALGMEKLGYAATRNDVKIYFWPSKGLGIQELSEADEAQGDRMVWIALNNRKDFPLIDPWQDRVLDQVLYGTQRADIFTGGTRIFFMLKKARPLLEVFERDAQS